jgi:DNA-binding XRE family transcriptional regulator
MITSERQLAVTKKKIQSLEDSLKKIEVDIKTKPLAKASKIQTQALIKELYAEVFEYEELKSKGLDAIQLNDLSEIMLVPIKYRIAKHMTQESFAKEVDVPLRMIARYESEGYRNITGETFHKILQKLHLKSMGKLKEA